MGFHTDRKNLCKIAMVLLAVLAMPSVVVGATGSGAVSSQVELQVYKKWIGASGNEADVEIHLICRDSELFEPRYINRDQTDGWTIENVPEEGMFCDVREIEQDTFIADVSDCLNLLVIPGQPAECTMVNTKVVKRINMLNRYGLIMMIAVMLGAGLAAVRKFAPL